MSLAATFSELTKKKASFDQQRELRDTLRSVLRGLGTAPAQVSTMVAEIFGDKHPRSADARIAFIEELAEEEPFGETEPPKDIKQLITRVLLQMRQRDLFSGEIDAAAELRWFDALAEEM